MASKEKKTPLSNKKQNPALKDNSTDTNQKSSKKGVGRPIIKKLSRNGVKKIIKKPGLSVKLKAKAKQVVPLNKKLNKTIFKNVKTIEAKKKILSNGVTEVKKRGRKKKNQIPDPEAIDKPKTRLTKKAIKEAQFEEKRNDCDDTLSIASDQTDVSNFDSTRPISKTRIRKTKMEPHTSTNEDISDNDLLLKKELDEMSESGKSDSIKLKKSNKKTKFETHLKDTKKENLEQTVIDSLDLNVRLKKTGHKTNIQRRRHSIEKFPIGNLENVDQHSSIFSQLPRSMSPRSRRNTKIRQSIDGLKRSSPYTTRSDSPARMLRNGKQRKLKDINLLRGLDPEIRKRRRLCSDLSSSDILKLSGYESDSSFSDLSSLHGAENSEIKDIDSIKTESESFDDKSFTSSTIIKRSISSDTAASGPTNNLTDSNSNIYDDISSVDINLNDKPLKTESLIKREDELLKSIASTPSVKVPEKSFLLDIMKQAFNSEDSTAKSVVETEPILPSKLYVPFENSKVQSDSENNKVSGSSEITKMQSDSENTEVQTDSEKFIDNEDSLRSNILSENQNENSVLIEDHSTNLMIDSGSKDGDSKNKLNKTPEDSALHDETLTAAIQEKDIIVERELCSTETISENISPPANITEIITESNILADIKNETPTTTQGEVIQDKNEIPVNQNVNNDIVDEKTFSEKEVLYNDEVVKQLTEELSNMENGELDFIEQNISKIEPSVETGNSKINVINEKAEEITPQSECPVESNILEASLPTEKSSIDIEQYDAPPILEPVIDNNKIDNNLEEQKHKCKSDPKTNESMPILESIVPDLIHKDDSDHNKENKQLVTDFADVPKSEESEEEKALKENILQALGLQSLQAAEEAKHLKSKDKNNYKSDNYTGTLKTVIKLNREKKKGRNSLKLTLQKNKHKPGDAECSGTEDGYKIMKENASSSWKHTTNSSDTAGAHRKSHYSNRSNLDGSSEHTSDGETIVQEGTAKALVIPEKASSFSIHPERLCKDECSYCFGKFGLFDTPCHIAQMKNVDRQDKILATEKHLTRDSCLCDACYRHVDRKSNTPSYTNKSLKRNSLVAPGPKQNHCHVLGCNKISTNILRRKWIIKMRKSICQVINIDLDNPGLHSIPICDEHYTALEHLMVCAMCKRRLARNHIHYLGPETADLNSALNSEGIPLILSDKPVVCKLCKCFAAVILKEPTERPENSKNFFTEYKKRLLHFNDIVPMDEAAAEEPIIVPSKSEKDIFKKKKKIKPDYQEDSAVEELASLAMVQNRVPLSSSPIQPESPEDFNSVDYNTLIPAIAMDCDSDSDSKREHVSKEVIIKRIPRLESVKEAVEISKNLKVMNFRQSDVAVTKLGFNPSISVRQLFPGEEDLPLQGHIDFTNVKEKTPEGWEKCISTIQYDNDTKHLWNELQKPYGNQSSFLRHLILLEKYFRNGDLVLSSKASHHAINYSESVQNRLKAFDNIPSNTSNLQPIAIMQLNKAQKSQSGIITSRKDLIPPISISSCTSKNSPIVAQLNIPPLLPPNTLLQAKVKHPGAPPGLISLCNNVRQSGPQIKPQSQKIKFPITKNWRPNLIPIDPTKKQEKRQGLVQVISGGKPYHITFEDYKKMCAIKRSFEMKERNKRLQEAQTPKCISVAHNSVLKTIAPRRGLVISKTSSLIKSEPLSSESTENETILEKLDKHVENIGSTKITDKASLLMPKIPKSLTVIPQTITKKSSRPSSPVLIITPKTNTNKS